MKIRFVKPVAGCVVHRAKTGSNGKYEPLPTEGCLVEYPGPDGYYARRVLDGSLTMSEFAPVKKPAPAAVPVTVPVETTKKEG